MLTTQQVEAAYAALPGIWAGWDGELAQLTDALVIATGASAAEVRPFAQRARYARLRAGNVAEFARDLPELLAHMAVCSDILRAIYCAGGVAKEMEDAALSSLAALEQIYDRPAPPRKVEGSENAEDVENADDAEDAEEGAEQGNGAKAPRRRRGRTLKVVSGGTA